jgi:hypothetical protein
MYAITISSYFMYNSIHSIPFSSEKSHMYELVIQSFSIFLSLSPLNDDTLAAFIYLRFGAVSAQNLIASEKHATGAMKKKKDISSININKASSVIVR